MSSPLSVINTLLPSFAYDQVAVFTQAFEQIFRDARAIKAVVKETAKVMEHPLETGAVITDHRITLPVEIELSMILRPETYVDTYKAIRSYYLSGTLLVIQTKTGIYANQLISSMPHEENPDQYNTISITLNLREALFVNPAFAIVPAAPSDSTTVDRGQQGLSAANAAQISLAIAVFQSYNNAGGNFQ